MFFRFKLVLILIGSLIPVFKWYTGTTYIYISRLEDCRLQCTDPNKMYEFKRDILWPPYVAGQAIYIFILSFVLFFIPCLISAVAEWMSTILRHMMWS